MAASIIVSAGMRHASPAVLSAHAAVAWRTRASALQPLGRSPCSFGSSVWDQSCGPLSAHSPRMGLGLSFTHHSSWALSFHSPWWASVSFPVLWPSRLWTVTFSHFHCMPPVGPPVSLWFPGSLEMRFHLWGWCQDFCVCTFPAVSRPRACTAKLWVSARLPLG